MSKGSRRRPSSISEEEYASNFEHIFGKKELKTWNPEEPDEQEKCETMRTSDPEAAGESSPDPEGPRGSRGH